MSSFQSENEQLPRSPPMAVLPLNASAKLDQEPNPFEQSFSSLSKDDNGCSKCDTARSNSDNRSNGGAANNGSSSLSSSSSSGEPNTTTSHHATTTDKPSLPSVADLTSPVPPLIGGGILPKDVTNHLAWDSLRTGPLSPSMLQGPLNPAEFGTIAVTNPAIVSAPYLSAATQRPIMDGVGIDPLSTTSTFGVPMQGPNNYVNARSASLSNAASVPSLTSTATIGGSMPAKQTATVSAAATTGQNVSKSISVDSPSNSPARKNTRRKAATAVDQDDKEAPKPAPRKRARTNASVKEEDDEKRRNFLERNRIAALKCRQRKKQWLNDLQKKAEYLASDNEQLQMQANSLREELINLKTLLLAHKDCPVSRANAQAAAAGGNPGLPSEATSNGGTTVACGSSQSPNNLAVPPVSSSPQQQQQPPPHMPTMQHTVMPFSTHQPAPSQGIVAGTAGVLRF